MLAACVHRKLHLGNGISSGMRLLWSCSTKCMGAGQPSGGVGQERVVTDVQWGFQ